MPAPLPNAAAVNAAAPPLAPAQLALDLGLPPAPDFDNFVPGANAECLARLRELANGRREQRLLYLWGPQGSGRSHLLAACARAAGERALSLGPTDRPHAFTPSALVQPDAQPTAANGWLFAPGTDVVRPPVPPRPAAPPGAPPASVPGATLLLLDDAQALSGPQQTGLFRLLVAAQEDPRVAVVMVGDAPPASLRLRADLRSRLAAALVYRVEPLSDAAKRDALLAAARARGARMAPEVADHLLLHYPRDLSALMAVLDALDRLALARKRAITLPLLREWALRRLESDRT